MSSIAASGGASPEHSLTDHHGLATSRPRVLGWFRSAAILDGDWGTSIAYVLGISFALAGYASFWHLIMMLALTTLVAVNYITICRLYPNGGGVYSSVYHRSRSLAVVGALLLTADYVITASLSVLDACHYLGLPNPELFAITIIFLIGALNWFGPRHSGAMAFGISAVTIVTLLVIVVVSAPQAIPNISIKPMSGGLFENWHIFVGIILSISGIEAISNMTGLMKDPTRDSKRAILAILAKVVLVTVFLALAMHAVPNISGHTEDMVRFLGEHYVGHWFGWIVAVALGLLLISAGNTALNDMISIQFLMSIDGELPSQLRKLNKHGVPILPLMISTTLPIIVLLIIHDVMTLSHLYAIGVVGAIVINVSSTGTDGTLELRRSTRVMMIVSGIILAAIEVSIAVNKHEATLFAAAVLALGLGARAVTQHARRRSERAAARGVPGVVEVPAAAEEVVLPRIVMPEAAAAIPAIENRFMVSVRGRSERLLKFAFNEARANNALLIIIRIKEIAVNALPDTMASLRDEDDIAIERTCRESGRPFLYMPIVSNDAGYTIAEQAATLGIDRLMLGATRRNMLEKALRGSVISTVGHLLPEEIQLVIFG